MPRTLVLIGGTFEVYDHALSGDVHLFHCVLGAEFQIEDEELAKRVVLDGAALIPKGAFDEIGFTADELKKYPNAKAQSAAPKDDPIHAKMLAARLALHDYRAQLASEIQEA